SMHEIRVGLSRERRRLPNERFCAHIGARVVEGVSDAQGIIGFQAPVTVRQILLELPDRRESFALRVGGLDPVDEPSGAHARLANLRFDPGITNWQLTAALRGFQEERGLDATGALDAATR